MLDRTDVTAGTDSDRETRGSISTVRKITEVMSNFETILNTVNVESLDGWNI